MNAVPGITTLARGAIPTADMLSDDVSVAKCDTRLALNAAAHANPILTTVSLSLFLRQFQVACSVPDLFSAFESIFALTLDYYN